MLLLGIALQAQVPSAAPDSARSRRDSTIVRDTVAQDTTLYLYPADTTDDTTDDYFDDTDDEYSIDTLNTISLLHARCSFGMTFDIAAVSAQDIISYINQNAGGNSI